MQQQLQPLQLLRVIQLESLLMRTMMMTARGHRPVEMRDHAQTFRALPPLQTQLRQRLQQRDGESMMAMCRKRQTWKLRGRVDSCLRLQRLLC